MPRRTEEEWRDLIAQQQSSGVSAAKFCRERAITSKYFSTRKKQLCGSANSFVQVAGSSVPRSVESPVKLRIIEVDIRADIVLDSLSLLLAQRER